MQAQPKFDMATLRRIGLQTWAPIGGEVSEDEYDTYLLHAADRLWHGGDLGEVVDYLVMVEVEWMGMGDAPGLRVGALRVASEISGYVEILRT